MWDSWIRDKGQIITAIAVARFSAFVPVSWVPIPTEWSKEVHVTHLHMTDCVTKEECQVYGTWIIFNVKWAWLLFASEGGTIFMILQSKWTCHLVQSKEQVSTFQGCHLYKYPQRQFETKAITSAFFHYCLKMRSNISCKWPALKSGTQLASRSNRLLASSLGVFKCVITGINTLLLQALLIP